MQTHFLYVSIANLNIDAIYAFYPESFCNKNLAIRKVFVFLNLVLRSKRGQFSKIVRIQQPCQMQGEKISKEVISQEGIRNGLKLTLDLHSNTVSFGTLFPQYKAFSLFVGRPSQFPTMRDASIQLEGGKEHFVDLSATVVTTNGIKEILPEARGCLFTDESQRWNLSPPSLPAAV